jgi:hypothetical protein
MNINQLGYVFADGDFKNLINKTDDSTTTFYSGSAITTNSIRSGDTISIEVYTTPTNLSTIITKSTYTYNDSPDRRYATEYINVEAIAALPSGDIYAIIKGSANWDYSRLLKIDKATSSIEISDEQTPFVNQYKFFINGNELFLSGGGLYKFDSNLKNRTLLESYSVKDVEFTDDGWIYISPNESTLSTIKKINFNGELDLSFGASGIFSRDIEKYDYEFVNDIALSQAGYIFAISLLGTQKPTPNQRPGIIKLLPSGKVDPTFGVGGIISGDAYTYIANPKIVIQNNEKPIVAYLSDNKYLIIQRYTSAGQLDQEFSFGGTFKFELPNKY